MYLQDNILCFGRVYHGKQQNPPFSKLHTELLEQFEGFGTFTNP